MITSFFIQKCEKKTEKAPDRRISAKVGDNFVEIGACWKKQDKKGNDYLSCMLAKPYKERKGFKIVEDDTE
jgi:uncharacterized protein (DUF736 family)